MLVGIVSDTHENMDMIDKAVKIFNDLKVSVVFHAGDIISPITFSHFEKLNCVLHLVFGNNDGEKSGLKEKFSKLGSISVPPAKFDLEGIKFILFHEPLFVEELALSGKFDYIIYGHTHKKDLRKIGNTLIINPGECSGWLTGEKSIAILDTDKKEVEFINL